MSTEESIRYDAAKEVETQDQHDRRESEIDEHSDLAKITHVAMRFRDKVYALPSPNRHYHVIAHIAEVESVDYIDSFGDDQGFLDANGIYLTRVQALERARACGQIKKWSAGTDIGKLFSEDVW